MCNDFRPEQEQGSLTYRAPGEQAEDINEVLASVPGRLRELPLLGASMKQAHNQALLPLRELLQRHGVAIAEEGPLFVAGARLSLDAVNHWQLLGLGENGEVVAQKVSEVLDHRLRSSPLRERLRWISFWVRSKSHPEPLAQGASSAVAIDVPALLAELSEMGPPPNDSSREPAVSW